MDTEKRLAICFALSMLVILAFSWINVDKNAQRRSTPTLPGQIQSATSTHTPTPTQAPKPETDGVEEPGVPSTDAESWNWLPDETLDPIEGKAVVVESELYRVTFSSIGALPLSWHLKKYDELFADPRLLKMRQSNGTLSQQQLADLELQLINKLVSEEDPPSVNAIYPKGQSGLLIKWGSGKTDRNIPYICTQDIVSVSDPTEVTFQYKNNGIQLRKIFRFYPDSYHLDFRIEIQNTSGDYLNFTEEENYYDVLWLGGFGYPSIRQDAKNNLHIQLEGSLQTVPTDSVVSEIKTNQRFLLPGFQAPDLQAPTLAERGQSVGWVGVGQKYFLAAIVPKFQSKFALKGISSPKDQAQYVAHPHAGIRRFLKPIRSGEQYVSSDNYKLYIGPVDEDYLAKVEEGLEDVKQIFLRSFVGPIANFMLKLLKGFHAIIPNYGVSIILLTLLIKLLMLPLYHKQMASMRKMQALQPHINALKEQYKDDPQKMQKEQMELFRKHKVNPLAGCLTMLPMLPIFIALYATFQMSVELRGEPFFWWIQDLSAPDQAFYIPMGQYIFTINILPIAYAILMLWNTSRQKMEGPNATMMKVMPIIFVFIFWSMASGVILYFVVNIFIDLIQRMVTDKLHPAEEIPVKETQTKKKASHPKTTAGKKNNR